MTKFLLSLCLVLVLACVNVVAQTANKWYADSNTAATTLVGVGAVSRSSVIAAAAVNGQGALVDTYNGTAWTKTPVLAGLIMDAAATPSGASIVTSMLQVFVSPDSSQTYVAAAGVAGLSQAAYTFGNNGEYFAAVGTWLGRPSSVGGVAYSKDHGASWAVSANVPVGSVRYGAFPTENTWYVSSGTWPMDEEDSQRRPLSARFHVDLKTEKVQETTRKAGVKGKDGEPSGWFGAVSKTTDGGATWTQVFSSDLVNDLYYFNAIACPSENHCTVVGEGDAADGGYINVAFTTFDGGVSWTKVIDGADVSMTAVDYLDDNEGWVAATRKSGRNLVAQLYHTTDGGKTFAIEDSLDNCFMFDLDFATDRTGVASCISSSGASCYAALYH